MSVAIFDRLFRHVIDDRLSLGDPAKAKRRACTSMVPLNMWTDSQAGPHAVSRSTSLGRTPKSV
jgi:hypothetical protein